MICGESGGVAMAEIKMARMWNINISLQQKN
jgi:hypothetical protein